MTFQEAEQYVRSMVPPPSEDKRHQLNPSFASLLRRFLKRLAELPSLLPDDLVIFIEIYKLNNPVEWIWSDTVKKKQLEAMRNGGYYDWTVDELDSAKQQKPDDHFQFPLPRT